MKMDLTEIDEVLNSYLHLQTYPLAIRMCVAGENVPTKTVIPSRDWDIQTYVCQAIGIARHYGWRLAISKEDISCTFGALYLGFLPVEPAFLEGDIEEFPPFTTREAKARAAKNTKRLEYGKYRHLLVAPLVKATFEPNLIVIYGNSAQVMLLVEAATQSTGIPLNSSTRGGADCSDGIVQTLLTNECRYVLPTIGDRYLGGTQDSEMIFTMPISKVEGVIEGLKALYKIGWRYPIAPYLGLKTKKVVDKIS